jgi:uncharacterized membrane protein
VGLALLWRAWQRTEVPRAGRSLLGLLLAGWGIFNLVKGIIDHDLLASITSNPARASSCSTWASSYRVLCCSPSAWRCTDPGLPGLPACRPAPTR